MCREQYEQVKISVINHSTHTCRRKSNIMVCLTLMIFKKKNNNNKTKAENPKISIKLGNLRAL